MKQWEVQVKKNERWRPFGEPIPKKEEAIETALQICRGEYGESNYFSRDEIRVIRWKGREIDF